MKTATGALLTLLLLLAFTPTLSALEPTGDSFDPTKLPGFEAILEQLGPFEQLEVEAYLLVRAHRYDEAASVYAKLVDIRPDASSLWIMLAHCFNAMNLFQDAYRTADMAITLDPDRTYYRIERGIAAFRIQKIDRAVEDLRAYTRQIPQSAQGHFYLGLALMADGKDDAALASLKRAASLDPDMELIAGPFIAELDARQGRTEEALSRLSDLSLTFEGMPVERVFRDRMEEIRTGRPARRGRTATLYASVKGFYDSNVISANDDAALPSGISSRRDEGIAWALGSRCRLFQHGRTALFSGLDLNGETYFSLDDYNTVNVQPSLRLDHRFTARWTGRLLARYNHTWLDSESYNHMFGIAPSFTHQWGRTRHHTTLGGDLKWTDYSRASPAPVDRDGTDASLFLSHRLFFLNERAQVGAGIALGRNETDGAEYEADYVRLSLDLAVPLGWKLVLAPALSYTDYDYDNISLYAANPTRRENEILEASVSLSRSLTERLSAFLDVTYTDNDSNIPVFEYDRTRVYLGVTCRF